MSKKVIDRIWAAVFTITALAHSCSSQMNEMWLEGIDCFPNSLLFVSPEVGFAGGHVWAEDSPLGQAKSWYQEAKGREEVLLSPPGTRSGTLLCPLWRESLFLYYSKSEYRLF
ncbi:MAG: hypothetical protein LBR65_07065 [Culturomica sp.]|nr:hypothetical protein [Culturomica sp.]